jgi:hypothetical protein
MLWNQKRDTYAALFKATDKLTNALAPLPGSIRRNNEATPATKATTVELVRAQLEELVAAKNALTSAFSFAVIFTSQECITQVKKYSDSRVPVTNPITAEWAETELANVRLHLFGLPRIAKQDLGIT